MTIKIGFNEYEIVEKEEDYKQEGASHGYFDPIAKKIVIHTNSPGLDKDVTLLHEILHAIFYETKHNDINEELIETISYWLINIGRRNPKIQKRPS